MGFQSSGRGCRPDGRDGHGVAESDQLTGVLSINPRTDRRSHRRGGRAAEAAAQAQREWAALPYDRRAAVMRRAEELFVDHEAEIHEWLIRESGAVRPFAGFQTRAVAAEECWEAAAPASHPYGELLRSTEPQNPEPQEPLVKR